MSKSNETVQVLRKARGLIRKGWVQNLTAADAGGREVSHTDPTAKRFCPVGAVAQATYLLSSPFGMEDECIEILAHSISRITHRKRLPDVTTLVYYNDSPKRTKAQVLKAFTLAIELAQAEG